MAIIYVGPSSAGAADGTSWANRYGTLNAAEDRPVAAGDTVYVGPGVYREMLTCDVSGTAGNPITYIADVTGQNTDGVGGIVRITGSDNDQTATRANGITGTSKDYRTFRGFSLDTFTADAIITATACSYWIVEDCVVMHCASDGGMKFGGTGTNVTVRRCIVENLKNTLNGAIWFTHSSTVSDAGHLIENCQVRSANRTPAYATQRVGGITIKNCFAGGCEAGVSVITALAASQTVTVNDCIITAVGTCFSGTTTGEITEDYNAISAYSTARTNTNTGANTVVYYPVLQPPLLYAGVRLPMPAIHELSEWSPVKAIAGTGEATDDFYGITRPTTSAKKSWGAVQYDQHDRETTTTYNSSAASLKLSDAGYKQFIVPVTAVSTTISVRCYREADYAGTNPSMVIKQPGQSDRTTTDAGSASAWNELTDTFTPSATPPYVIVELQSLNTATSGNYDAFFDSLAIS